MKNNRYFFLADAATTEQPQGRNGMGAIPNPNPCYETESNAGFGSTNTKPENQPVEQQQNNTTLRRNKENTLPHSTDTNSMDESASHANTPASTDQLPPQVPINPSTQSVGLSQPCNEEGGEDRCNELRRQSQIPQSTSEQCDFPKTDPTLQQNHHTPAEKMKSEMVLELVHEEDVFKMINTVTTGRDNESIVTLSPSQCTRGEYVNRHDLKSLLSKDITGDGWVNSQTVWIISCLMMERSLENTDLPRVKILDSCYFKTNKKNGTHRDNLERACSAINTLEGWDLILIPLSNGTHWYLYALDMRKKTIQAYDSLHSGDFHRNGLQEAKNIIQKMVGEVMENWTIHLDDTSPIQGNTHDCGVFMMCAMQCLCLDDPLQYTQNKMELFRKYFLCSIFMEHMLGILLIYYI